LPAVELRAQAVRPIDIRDKMRLDSNRRYLCGKQEGER